MQLTQESLSGKTFKLAVADSEFDVEIREISFSDGPALVASTPTGALALAHRLGAIPKVLGCPQGYRAVPIMLSEPGKRDERPVRVPWSWELIRTEQGGAAV